MRVIPDKSAEHLLRLYDLSTAVSSHSDFLLPLQSAEVYGFLWSPDSRYAYFLLEDSMVPQSTFSLWRLDVITGAIEQAATIPAQIYIMDGISPDGKWMAERYPFYDEGLVLDLKDGQAYAFSLPHNACLAGWR